MSFKIGIVGLPNVGKSTLFNALTRQAVLAANYPFATVDPNVGVVAVPDERLQKLAELEKSKKIVPTAIEFVDIAGLVKDAHKGAGLGNQFLSHIREVDAIVEVVRCFEDANVIHVEGKIDAKRDVETIETELVLADLQLVEKKIENLRSKAKSGRKEDVLRSATAEKYFKMLAEGKSAKQVQLTPEETQFDHEFPLLTKKPILYVANVKQGSISTMDIPGAVNQDIVTIDCQLEAELAQLANEEKTQYLAELGMTESGLDQLIKAAYKTLGLITFLTTGPDETRAWTITKGSTAPVAAGKIHTDFERGFIKAEVINWEKLLHAGGWGKARELGWLGLEGKEYVVQDGDVIVFKHAT